MNSLRQRASILARRAARARPVAISRTSVAPLTQRLKSTTTEEGHVENLHGGHHDHHGHNVKEPLGLSFWSICAIIPTCMLVYHLAQPDADGNLPAVTRAWARYQNGLLQHWQTQSDLQNAVIQEAGHERHLLFYSARPKNYDLSYPEVFETGSRRSVPAGHYINLDKVKAHYRQQYLEEEERKAKRLVALASETEASEAAPAPQQS